VAEEWRLPPVYGVHHPFRSSVVAGGGGVPIQLHRSGQGPPVILLHGFPDQWTTWSAQIDPLVDAGYSVLVPELRGYGRSGRPPGPGSYRVSALVEDLLAVIAAAGGRASLVAHDWGGVIAWALALRSPAAIDRLAILNAPHPHIFRRRVLRPPQLFRSWYVFLFQIPRLPEWLLSRRDFVALRRLLRDAVPRDPSAAERVEALVSAFRPPGALRAAIDYYRAARARGGAKVASAPGDGMVAVPTLVLWGARDPALGLELTHQLARYVPDLRLRVLPAAAHWIQHEEPDTVTRELLAFLAPMEG
jgi:epoxide hydrolase 4